MTVAVPNPIALDALRRKLAELSDRSVQAGRSAAGSVQAVAAVGAASAVSVLPTGVAALDQALGGGLPRGRLVELSGAWSSGKATLALTAAARVTAAGRLCLYVDGRGELYPPSAAALGVDLARLLVVGRPQAGAAPARPGLAAQAGAGPSGSRDRWAAAGGAARAGEIAARTGAFPLVVLDLADDERVDEPGAARLRAAASSGGAVVLALAPRPGGLAQAPVELEAVPGALVVRKGGAGAPGARVPWSALGGVRVDHTFAPAALAERDDGPRGLVLRRRRP